MSESQLIEYKESWRAYGIAEPEYTVHPNDIMMMFKANGTVNDTVKTILALYRTKSINYL